MKTIEHKPDTARAKRQLYIYKQLINIEMKLNKICKRNEELAARVSPEMIDAAREYPIEDLLDITRGRAVCPFCTDHMMIKCNKYMCLVCGSAGDPIDLLMHRDGLTFRDSIRRLM